MFDNKPHYHLGLPPFHRRLLCESLEARTLLSVGLAGISVGDGVHAASAAQHQTQAHLPVAAQHAISSAIGQDQSAYHAASVAAGVILANPSNGFTAQLQSGALHVSAGSDTWDMSLVGLRFGGVMQPVGTAKTSTNGNRVDCNYRTVDEWYVNGPGGLEQGFTIASPAQPDARGSLTVELALGGDLVGTVNAPGDGLTLSRPDGSVALCYTGLTAYDATGKTLPASLEVRAEGSQRELLIHVNAFGAQGTVTIDPFLQEAELAAPGGEYTYGAAVAICGNTIVVGSGSTWVDGNIAAGTAFVFTEPASGWADVTQTATLTASDGSAHDDFGYSVSISSNTVVIGAIGYHNVQGAAYVFTEPASGWADMTQTAKLTAPGGSVSISGNTVVVGPIGGGAAVFAETASGWTNVTQTATLTASDGLTNDYFDSFGESVSISGNTVVVGDFPANGDPGAAYVFAEPASGWADMTQTAKLTASDGARNDYFGESVSISGNTLVVGARGPNDYQGAAYVFTEPASGWADMTETDKLTASDGAAQDNFGYSVSIDGNTLVVGAPLHRHVFPNDGMVYVFTAPPTPVTVTAADWNAAGLTLTLGSDGNLHVYITGTTTDAVPPVAPTSVSNIEITSPSDTTASLTIDSTAGDPIPPGGLTYSGAGGLIITSSGSVTLSGSNRYTGGTTVLAGVLQVSSADALPDGGSLTVGAGGTFLFDLSSAGTYSNMTVATAASVSANALPSNPVLPALASADVVNHSVSRRNSQSPIVPPSALQRPHSVPAVAVGTPAKRIAGDLAWLKQTANDSDNSDQQRKKDVAILALEAVFAQYCQ